MIGKLRIENFKSIKKMELSFGRVNVIIGWPNSGKSNILESIGVLSSLGHDLNRLQNFVRFDKMIDLFHNQNTRVPFEIATDLIGINAVYDGSMINMFVQDNKKKYGHHKFTMEGYHQGYVGEDNNEAFKKFKYYIFDPKVEFWQERPDYLQPPSGDNLPNIVFSDNEISKIMKDIFNSFGYKILLDPYEKKISLLKETKNLTVSLPYRISSEGLRRLIFYKIAVKSNENSVITMEEPESNLFPYYISNFAESLGMDKGTNQFLISTHNPYFLESIVEKTPKKDLRIYFSYIEKSETKVKLLSEKDVQNLLEGDPFFSLEKIHSRG